MLNIYYGGENTDKEKFIFSNIKGRTFLLVPDQFSLQAERDAFFYLNKKGLMDIRVVDFSSLGHKVIAEAAEGEPPLIDKYGRHMLLAKIIEDNEESLKVYRGLKGKNSFIEMVNSFISEMKRFEIDVPTLLDVKDYLEENSFLKYKLEDILKIYSMYEEAIKDKYLDSEDYITFYGEKILNSQMIAGSHVWVYGFDTFTPKNFLVMERILKRAESLNVVMTYEQEAGEAGGADDEYFLRQVRKTRDAGFLAAEDRNQLFSITGYIIEKLVQMAEKAGEESRVEAIAGFVPETSGKISSALRRGENTDFTPGSNSKAGHAQKESGLDGCIPEDHTRGKGTQKDQSRGGYLRDNLWSKEAAGALSEWENQIKPVTLACTSNVYAEAERAADYIWRLVKEEGYKFADIVVVCNDTEFRSNVLRRTFLKWGIPVFVDKKRKVMHHPAVGFLLALVETAFYGYRDSAVMSLIKSGFLGLEEDCAERLENYVRQFKIKGGMWKKAFSRTGDSYTAEDLNQFNQFREKLTTLIDGAKAHMGKYNKAGEKVRGLYNFLADELMLEQRIQEMVAKQREQGLEEGAAETAQSWNVICEILEQIVKTLGDERISGRQLLELMKAGFEAVEIGLVPVTSDAVLIGTMQRTRLSRLKALLVVGANEGLLPLEASDEGLLNDREKSVLEGFSLEIAKSEKVMRQEERLAVYRTFSLPSEKLYVSCSRTDEKGETVRESSVFRQLESYVISRLSQGEGTKTDEMIVSAPVLTDLEDEKEILNMLTSQNGAVTYMTEAFRTYMEGGDMDRRWLEVARWYEENRPRDFERVKRGMLFDNRRQSIGEEFADALYRGDRARLETSASRLEKYSSCPFAHFISYGLRPEEERLFEIGAREIGDVYHECIMRLSRKLTAGGRELWKTITRDECRREVKQILENEIKGYREGLLSSGKNEEYRTERIEEICSGAAYSLIEQLRKGSIENMFFERPFGSGKNLPPIKVSLGSKDVFIKGKIDRIDILNPAGENDEKALRIVDYKTGNDAVNADYFRSGYKLQLMVYLKAAMGQGDLKPAGVFLFKIKEVDDDAGRTSVKPGDEALAERMESAYKMEGIVLNESDVIESMDGDFEQASKVIPVKKMKKTGAYAPSAGGQLFTAEEFKELSEQVDAQIERICREICGGNVEIAPKRERNKDMEGKFKNSCKYCGYKSICMFDTAFEGCRFQWV